MVQTLPTAYEFDVRAFIKALDGGRGESENMLSKRLGIHRKNFWYWRVKRMATDVGWLAALKTLNPSFDLNTLFKPVPSAPAVKPDEYQQRIEKEYIYDRKPDPGQLRQFAAQLGLRVSGQGLVDHPDQPEEQEAADRVEASTGAPANSRGS
jgi:hypothetical protein